MVNASTPVGTPATRQTMNYTASVRDFFKSPKWGMNMLLGGVSMLIPVVGPMVLSGWQISGFWGRGDNPDPAEFPPFDFQHFVKYLERGLWPFLVNLVASMVLVPVIMVVFFLPLMLSGIFDPHHGNPDAGPIIAVVFVAVFVLYLLLMLSFYFIITPLILRATLVQEFAASFDFQFVKRFIALMWQEMVVAMAFMFGLMICLMLAGMLLCFVGIYFTVPISVFSWHHLQKQLYQTYLARGGEPVPLSPKLRDEPPPVLPPVLPPA